MTINSAQVEKYLKLHAKSSYGDSQYSRANLKPGRYAKVEKGRTLACQELSERRFPAKRVSSEAERGSELCPKPFGHSTQTLTRSVRLWRSAPSLGGTEGSPTVAQWRTVPCGGNLR